MDSRLYFKNRLIHVLLIVGIIIGYNQMLEKKELESAVAASNQQLEQVEQLLIKAVGENEDKEKHYKDGTYEGTGTGFGGEITVSLTVKEGEIKKAEILSAEKEDSAYLDTAKGVLDRIVTEQTSQVEAVSGATFSSQGIIEAAKKALEKAVE